MVREAPLKFTRELTSSLVIQSVSTDVIRVSGKSYALPIALTPSEVLSNWNDKPLADLEDSDFAELLAGGPEIVVIGTGAGHVFPPRELMFAFARRGVGLEVMDTAAAARTFNVLAAEGRKIAAVLYIAA
ncbi:MAG: Mth938-like domain-containing protein [Gammaproteobacteria bacterium]|nr:Mth938-like domain-containing protein [Gammaproteobacteria bacterium]